MQMWQGLVCWQLGRHRATLHALVNKVKMHWFPSSYLILDLRFAYIQVLICCRQVPRCVNFWWNFLGLQCISWKSQDIKRESRYSIASLQTITLWKVLEVVRTMLDWKTSEDAIAVCWGENWGRTRNSSRRISWVRLMHASVWISWFFVDEDEAWWRRLENYIH